MKLELTENCVSLGSVLLLSLKAKPNTYLSVTEKEIKVYIHNCIFELKKKIKNLLSAFEWNVLF